MAIYVGVNRPGNGPHLTQIELRGFRFHFLGEASGVAELPRQRVNLPGPIAKRDTRPPIAIRVFRVGHDEDVWHELWKPPCFADLTSGTAACGDTP
jgi:hypothetical protein